ncbi:unnamed protein product [Chondrus crispus]|uniref:Uncharacterized protein n=1 Tax=Chondrus crispus TaxID=2769 RepID=R7QCV0_CHOCR|nr:unnamed protein product [Chondrus crispus]CDF35588.1 unnamed protein product [Chondrus crispus]|eukprot:XP_005715407.1 unnamed protein product [Chondrus crispus]
MVYGFIFGGKICAEIYKRQVNTCRRSTEVATFSVCLHEVCACGRSR